MASVDEFNKALVSFIVNVISNKENIVDCDGLRDYLNSSDPGFIPPGFITPGSIKDVLDRGVKLDGVCFPEQNVGIKSFGLIRILEKLKKIEFNSCFFYSSYFNLKGVECFYAQCKFLVPWSINSISVFKKGDAHNVNNVLYEKCVFKGNVSKSYLFRAEDHRVIDVRLFSDCEFSENIIFEHVAFSCSIFNNSSDFVSKIERLIFSDCVIEERFIVNNFNCVFFELKNSIFESKVEIKGGNFDRFFIVDSNFSKIVDAYGSSFKEFSIKKSIFDDFVGFEDCKFGGEGGATAMFVYATFLNFASFRDACFNSGLNLDRANLEDPPNFLNSTINMEGSTRETFRIVKHSFDDVGNYIEANKYFSYEMKKYKEEIKGSGSRQEQLVFFMNEKISNFGQDYVRPIIMILIFALAYYLCVLGYENNVLYNGPSWVSSTFSGLSGFLNGVAKNILPFSRFLKDGMEFVSLIFYIIFAGLAWQILVAIKRHTRR